MLQWSKLTVSNFFSFYLFIKECIKCKKMHKSTPDVYNEQKMQSKKEGKQKTTPSLNQSPSNLKNQLMRKNSH